MTQAQFHNKVLAHYHAAAKRKRNHPINEMIKSMKKKIDNARNTRETLIPKIVKGKATQYDISDFNFCDGVIDSLSLEVLGLNKLREELFDLIDSNAQDTEPRWNGREPLREEVDLEKMQEILHDMRERDWQNKNPCYLTTMTTIERTLIQRDGYSREEAREALQEARERVTNGEDPEEILYEDFGLEPDFIFDLI